VLLDVLGDLVAAQENIPGEGRKPGLDNINVDGAMLMVLAPTSIRATVWGSSA